MNVTLETRLLPSEAAEPPWKTSAVQDQNSAEVYWRVAGFGSHAALKLKGMSLETVVRKLKTWFLVLPSCSKDVPSAPGGCF